jgi:chemotaxis methyl-accepting protein methylase
VARAPEPSALEPQLLEPGPLEAILAEVARRRGIDFRDYRRDSLQRGVRARMAEQGTTELDVYRRSLEDEGEVTRLIEAMVVPWSRFFRDPAVFQALADQVLPALVLNHLERRPVRTWCVGAATGEEAWTMAMLLAEACDLPGGPSWELMATDIDRRTLAAAESGNYPVVSLDSVPERYGKRHLLAEGGRVQVAPALRSRVRFAFHDLLGHTLAPPAAIVAAFDLVLVRNVLIYFDRRLQEKALARLAAVLPAGGALVLGEVETLPEPVASRFAPFPGLDPSLRIYELRDADGVPRPPRRESGGKAAFLPTRTAQGS